MMIGAGNPVFRVNFSDQTHLIKAACIVWRSDQTLRPDQNIAVCKSVNGKYDIQTAVPAAVAPVIVACDQGIGGGA